MSAFLAAAVSAASWCFCEGMRFLFEVRCATFVALCATEVAWALGSSGDTLIEEPAGWTGGDVLHVQAALCVAITSPPGGGREFLLLTSKEEQNYGVLGRTERSCASQSRTNESKQEENN